MFRVEKLFEHNICEQISDFHYNCIFLKYNVIYIRLIIVYFNVGNKNIDKGTKECLC